MHDQLKSLPRDLNLSPMASASAARCTPLSASCLKCTAFYLQAKKTFPSENSAPSAVYAFLLLRQYKSTLTDSSEYFLLFIHGIYKLASDRRKNKLFYTKYKHETIKKWKE
jgi:hypothetical protein